MPVPIPTPGSHYISLTQFLDMKNRYATNAETILASPYHGQNILCTSELFNVAAVNAVAAVTGCAAVRIYYGMDEDLKVHAMLVAADENGQDILPPAGGVIFEQNPADPPIVEEGQRCPPFCP
jgi:hypothetical protein